MRVDLDGLAFSEGGHLLVLRALRRAGAGRSIDVSGSSPELETHLRAWCRANGHRLDASGGSMTVTCGPALAARWHGAERAGSATGVPDPHPPGTWGLAARGATVEAGVPDFGFPLDSRLELWAPEASRLYAQAAASQWDPRTAIDWDIPFDLPEEVEDAVVQIMTYLIENETAALVVPSGFISRMHPHFREVMQLLAIQAADEARHIEVFTRRALLKRPQLGLSTAGGQESLKTLMDEPDFAVASFLLSVLGEGTFLSLLRFIERHAPDPVTAAVARLAAVDEARHVAFGLAHLREHAREDPALLPRLAAAVHRRHDALRHTAGLNAEVYDALLLLAAGSWAPDALRAGSRALDALVADMDESRRQRLLRLGFDSSQASELSALHTRNFM